MPAKAPLPDAAEVVDFWLNEVGWQGWYGASDALDDAIRTRFHDTWALAHAGKLGRWKGTPDGLLAFIILTDQFPRNMFRGDGRSFATDTMARKAANKAIHEGWDLRIPEPQRQFIYLPYMHSEFGADQGRSVRMFLARMPQTGAQNLVHARAHRDVIRQFGRFPYRNAALGRNSTPAEVTYLAKGGYGSTVAALSEVA